MGVCRGGTLLSLALALAVAASVGGERARAQTFEAPASASARFVPGEVLVRYREGTGLAERRATRARVGPEDTARLPVPDLELVELGAGQSVRSAVRELENQPDVLYAEPNFMRRFHAVPNDPLFKRLWGLHNNGARGGVADADIDAPEAWDVTMGDSGVLVALLDSGVNYNHPDLASKIWANPGETGAGRETNGIDDDGNGFVDDFRGWDFFDDDKRAPDNDPMDPLGHGTHTGGTIAAAGNNGIGVVGVAPETTLMPLKIGGFGPSVATSIRAIRYANKMGADVANMSYGGWPRSQAEQDAIRAADDTLFAISAGNQGSNNDKRPMFPCAYRAKNIVCVAASTNRDELARFSSFGARSVDIAAPGVGVLSTAWRPVPEARFREAFDKRLRPRWRSSGPGNQWGIVRTRRRLPLPPRLFPEPIYVKKSKLADSPDGRYENNANTAIRGPAISLADGTGCALDYRLSGKLERGYDFLHVEGRNGSQWDEIARYSGRLSGKRSESLADFDGDPAFRFRFRLESDAAGREDGVKIGSLKVTCRTRYWNASGTSMAAPHVAGAAALLAAQFPAADPRELKARLHLGADRRRAFRGKVASGGRLNIARSLTKEDATAPQTDLAKFELVGRRARAKLRSSEPLSRFRCKLDDEAWANCRALHKTGPLALGFHVFRAVAIDYFGNEDPTPAKRRFRVGG